MIRVPFLLLSVIWFTEMETCVLIAKKKKREAKRKGCWKKNILEVYNYRDFDLCDNDLRFNSHDYIILKEDEF